MKFLFFGLALLAGLSNPIQSAANAALNKSTGQTVLTALVIYAVALCGLAACAAFLGVSFRNLGGRLGGLPWWAFVGGLCNLVFVLTAAVSTQKIGSGAFTVTTLVAAVLLSIALDKYGLMGMEARALTWQRVVGGVMAISGVVLVARY